MTKTKQQPARKVVLESELETNNHKCNVDGEKDQVHFEVDVIMPAAKNCCEGDGASAGADKIEVMVKKRLPTGYNLVPNNNNAPLAQLLSIIVGRKEDNQELHRDGRMMSRLRRFKNGYLQK
jgi:hypothetical protein